MQKHETRFDNMSMPEFRIPLCSGVWGGVVGWVIPWVTRKDRRARNSPPLSV